MNFLIAGGAGAVGRDLTGALLKKGHAVRVLDTNTEGFPLSGQFLADSWRLCTCKAEQLFGYSTRLSHDSARESLKGAIGRGLNQGLSGS